MSDSGVTIPAHRNDLRPAAVSSVARNPDATASVAPEFSAVFYRAADAMLMLDDDDFNNPLTAILGYTELAPPGGDSPNVAFMSKPFQASALTALIARMLAPAGRTGAPA